jgi:hypothetical protein
VHPIVTGRTQIEGDRVENAWNEVVQARALRGGLLEAGPAVCVERAAAIDYLDAADEAVRLTVAAIATRKGAIAIS